MALDADKIYDLLLKKESDTYIGGIILDYLSLKQKLKNIDKQSWYFKNGLQANRKKLISLRKSYKKLREDYNKVTINDLKQNIVDAEKLIKDRYSKRINSIEMYHYRYLLSEISFNEELIYTKKKVEILQPIDYYETHTDELIKLID